MKTFKTNNLTQVIVALSSQVEMLAFLGDRERTVRSKLRREIETGTHSGALQDTKDELTLILALRKEITD